MTNKVEKTGRILGIIAILTILIAWWIGTTLSEGDLLPSLPIALAQAARFENLGNDVYAGYETNTSKDILGYVSVASANGYGGPMEVAIGTDLEGNIVGLAIVNNKETPSFLNRILESDYIKSFIGKSFQENFQLGADVDGISGATYSSLAIANTALQGSRTIASQQLGLSIPVEVSPKVQFGIPEIVLIGLYVVGFIGHQKKFKYTKQARWFSMLVGMIVLGFIYTRPLTLSDINKFLLGFWPAWQTNLYWYLLIGGMLLVFTVDNKNPYCEWFCPFGAAQECMGAIGGAKTRSPGRFKTILIWVQRGLAWLAIVLALLFRNPGLSSYEIFGTLFDLNGTTLQFALLGAILVSALFIRRPWCTYLCPIRPVTDLYRSFRKWIIELWKRKRTKPEL